MANFINIHMLPFFSQDASTANESWPLVLNDLDWFIDHGEGKKMYLDEVSPRVCAAVVSGDLTPFPRTAGLR